MTVRQNVTTFFLNRINAEMLDQGSYEYLSVSVNITVDFIVW